MANKSTGVYGHFGDYPSVAQLPNAAGAVVQTSELREGSLAWAAGALYACADPTLGAASWLLASPPSAFVFVAQKSDFPEPVAGVITLGAATTYLIVGTVDLTGDRLVAGENTVIMGTSSEASRLKSTGLAAALITSTWSLPMRFITIEADLALDLNGDGVTTALDWMGVNFTDCAVVGTVANYGNMIWTDCALLNSGGLTFDGTLGTIGFNSCLFNGRAGTATLIWAPTLTITRRFRIIYSSFIVLAGEIGINADPLATIPDEGYILDTVNFSGGGTYLAGVTATDIKALFRLCAGVTNSFVGGQLYMNANAAPTAVALTNTYYKVAGVTTQGLGTSHFTASANRLTCDAALAREYQVTATVTFTSGNNNVCRFAFFDSALGGSGIHTDSAVASTANGTGRAENITFTDVVALAAGDYIEVHAQNNTAATDIVVVDLHLLIVEVS